MRNSEKSRSDRHLSNHPQWNCEVVTKAVTEVRPREGNPRKHSARQIRQIMRSIERFGLIWPILTDRDGNIIAHAAVFEAAKRLGFETIPVIVSDTLTKDEIRAFVIADNKLCENGSWNEVILAQEFRHLVEIDFEAEITGFEMAEIDGLIQLDVGDSDVDEADEVPSSEGDSPIVSLPGDLWILGEHRLYCGDATQASSYESVLAGTRARMVFSDPPYGVPIHGHVSGLGKNRHREFIMGSGEMNEQEFITFLRTISGHLATYTSDGAISFICMDWRHIHELLTACRETFTELKNICTWAKSNGGMGSLYRSRTEFVAVFKNGRAPHVNNVQLGRFGRYRSNLWQCAGMNSFGSERDEALAIHPTVKPVALVADAILDVSKRGSVVLDPFSGSGTTIMAAEKTGRRAAAIELDPGYVDVAIQRFRKHVGKPVTLEATGQTFDEVQAERTVHGEGE